MQFFRLIVYNIMHDVYTDMVLNDLFRIFFKRLLFETLQTIQIST